MSGCWVFGYGSLVSPASFGHTIGRVPVLGSDLFEADLAGHGRRWNYGVTQRTAVSVDDAGRRREWTIVALGLVAAGDESTNGVIGWVTDDELVRLDARERNYDRVDVTAAVTTEADIDGPIVTYVPRSEPVSAYERARELGRAAVERRYWELVDAAFAALGPDRQQRYHATTPAPDVPIVAMVPSAVPDRHRVGRAGSGPSSGEPDRR